MEKTRRTLRNQALVGEAQAQMAEAAQLLFKAERNLAKAGEAMAADWLETARRSVDSQTTRIIDHLQNGEA